jgi:restriction system protein
MTQQYFALGEPIWREPRRSLPLLPLLVVGTVIWLLLYAALGWRLWQNGALRIDAVSLALLIASIIVGVALVLSWRMAWPDLRVGRATGGRALSLAQMYQLTPAAFEEYVAQRLFARAGFDVENTRDVKDGGIDVLITDRYNQRGIVQCKRYRDTVGEPTVRDLFGTMLHGGAVHAYLVTTAPISDAARKWAADKPITLIDGSMLEQLVK